MARRRRLPPRDSRGKFLPKGRRRRRRARRNADDGAGEANPRRRRRGGGRRRRRRGRGRRNPGTYSVSLGARNPTFGDLRQILGNWLPVVGGRLWNAWVARRWGGGWGGAGILGGQTALPASPYHGQSWPLQSYIVGILGQFVGARIVRTFRPGWEFTFFRSGIENMMTRFVWTELIARSTWAQTQFGAAVADDGGGTRWVKTPTGWQSMMGRDMRALEEARALDGLRERRALDALESARPLDGLRRERGVDMPARGVGGRRYQGSSAPGYPDMGHYLEPGTEDTAASYHGAGYATLYHSAYNRG